MGAQEDSARKREFQKKTDEDIDSFIARKDFSKSVPAQPAKTPVEATREKAPPPPEKKEPSEEEQEEQIKLARTSRAQLEAYHDVVLLRKKAHAYGHRAAKFYHKHKANEAKAQKCSARAVAYREKAAERRDKSRNFKDRAKEYEAELSGAAQGKTELSPESLRTKAATMERKSAKQEEMAKKFEARAAVQTAKASKFRTRAAKFLEQNKLNESEARLYAKRADNLEKAGL